ncbi:MAG: hypothetical protein IPN48_04980 [Sphingomonadales bacterium]|nr:hypothetical protein [Sphingomonadales bacterium]
MATRRREAAQRSAPDANAASLAGTSNDAMARQQPSMETVAADRAWRLMPTLSAPWRPIAHGKGACLTGHPNPMSQLHRRWPESWTLLSADPRGDA